MRLDEIVNSNIEKLYHSRRQLFARKGFDYGLFVVIGNGSYLDLLGDQKHAVEFILNEYLVNAHKAIYGTDDALRTANSDLLKSKPARIRVHLKEAATATILSVSDNGDGVPPENHERIFRDKFSTRRTTGMGLKCVFDEARSLGARVYFESEVGKGSTFYLELPKQS